MSQWEWVVPEHWVTEGQHKKLLDRLSYAWNNDITLMRHDDITCNIHTLTLKF